MTTERFIKNLQRCALDLPGEVRGSFVRQMFERAGVVVVGDDDNSGELIAQNYEPPNSGVNYKIRGNSSSAGNVILRSKSKRKRRGYGSSYHLPRPLNAVKRFSEDCFNSSQ